MRIVLDPGTRRGGPEPGGASGRAHDGWTGPREVHVGLDPEAVTLGEVLRAAGLPVPATVGVDDRVVATSATVREAAVPDGAIVRLHGPPPRRRAVHRTLASPRLTVVTGPDAGRAVDLDRPVVVGRDATCDLVLRARSVGRRHCRVVGDGRGVVVSPVEPGLVTWVDSHRVERRDVRAPVGALLRLGDVVLRVEPAAPDDRPRDLDPVRDLGTDRVLPWQRPPRAAAPAAVAPVATPGPAPGPTAMPSLGVAAVLAPVALGLALVAITGSWRYGLFLLLSPVMMLATGIAGRRAARRTSAAASAARRRELAAFDAALAAAAEAERARRWDLLPSPAEVARRGRAPSTRLWERRRGDADFGHLLLGVGVAPWDPPVGATGPLDEDVAEVVARRGRLPRAPVAVDLGSGHVVGVVGDRAGAADLARSLLLQACVHHGPADLAVAVVTDEARRPAWGWTTWLPHVVADDGGRRLAADEGRAELLAELRRSPRDPDAAPLLVVVDAPAALRGRDADAVAVLRGDAGPVTGIVVAPSADLLPAACDTVVEVTDGACRVLRADTAADDDLLPVGADTATCTEVARRLARFADADTPGGAADLPTRVDLLSLLDTGPDADTVRATWDAAAGGFALATPIGLGPDGPVTIDLVADGPHGLVGGTTGAGKSELLRTLVAGLAARHGPDECTFVLIDYKGGAAFDACAGLPHVVGVVTDLDEHLGARALRCLEAELLHREQRLREAGVGDLLAWRALPSAVRGAPLPRLVVVVDEFATLRAELPDFVTSLVGVAQRGRSLGVHLVLGTQRPAGAVDEDVRANTNLRIALRTTDERDAMDVVGVPDAAGIPPGLPGRAVIRRGPEAPEALQTALVSGIAGARADRRVRLGPVRFAADDTPPTIRAEADGPTDLERLVAACRTAAADLPPPRRPWPDPLPDVLPLRIDAPAGDDGEAAAARAGDAVACVVPPHLGLLDDPDHQRRVPVGWEPEGGNLLVVGAPGSGTTTTLATAALALAASRGPDDLHLQVLDHGRGDLSPLAELPHCGAVVRAGEPERPHRLVALLLAEAARRRGLASTDLEDEPMLVVLVDGLDGWLAGLDEPATHDQHDALVRLLADAPRLRMAVAATVPRWGAVRSGVAAAFEHRLVHRVADPTDVAALGLHPATFPELPAGRAMRPRDGLVLQVAIPEDLPGTIAAVAASTGTVRRPPAAVPSTPPRVAPADVEGALTRGERRWRLPVGLDATTLAPVGWDLHAGQHALVLGPPGSGRTTLLAGLGAVALAAGGVEVVAVGADLVAALPAARAVAADRLRAVLTAAAAAAPGAAPALLVLVDDADAVPDPGVAHLADSGGIRVIAAADQARVAADYGHWLRGLGSGRVGAFLRPVGDVPEELLGARLPRHAPVTPGPGRGWVVGPGAATFAQFVA